MLYSTRGNVFINKQVRVTPRECSAPPSSYLGRLVSLVEPVAEAATMLGVSRQRVLQLIHEGSLEAVKVGRAYFVSALSLQERMEAQNRRS